MIDRGRGVTIIGTGGNTNTSWVYLLHDNTPTTVTYCDNRVESERLSDTVTYQTSNFTCSCDPYQSEADKKYWKNYWHAIEMRSYWYQPKKIGKVYKPQIKPLTGFARSKLHKNKLKPELCLK